MLNVLPLPLLRSQTGAWPPQIVFGSYTDQKTPYHVQSIARTSPSQVNINNAPTKSSKQQSKRHASTIPFFDYTWISLIFKMVIQGHNLIVLHAITMQVVILVHLIRAISYTALPQKENNYMCRE
jgi:hypothetical protein